MDWTIIILLFVAGLLGGLVNAIAGGATLLTFPAMLAAGLPPVVANASNAVAIAPGHLLAALADWTKLRPFDQSVILSLMIAIIGGALGALLVLALPERLFVLPIPGLIGLGTCLFAFAPQIQSWTHKRNGGTRPSPVGDFAALASASLYGGFFGAGLGIVLTALLSMAEPDDLRRVKVFKNLLAAGVSLAAISVFIFQGLVQWPETLCMLTGALLGGYAGGRLIRILPARMIRVFVITAGLLMTIIYAQHYW